MLFTFLRSLRSNNSASAPRRLRPVETDRTVLAIESLERRDLLSGFVPQFLLVPQTGLSAPYATAAATGFSPSQISQAYGFNQIAFNNGAIQGNGSGQTIAIVDAYSQPDIASDLQSFDSAFGLPAPPSFHVVNQNGGRTLPAPDAGWGIEESLDVEWAHAMAPGANILLVEANSSSENDLFSAVKYAAPQPGVSVVSLSWGGGEFGSETNFDSVFTTPTGHQGVAFVASSGDNGAPASYPAVSPNVLAIGGTSLYMNGSNYGSESGWSGSGGGLSAYEAQPNYQQGVVGQSSTQRTSPDVSYDADPNTGFSVYDTYGTPSGAPWLQIGGTSAGTPQWAALVAIADQGRALKGLGTLDSGSQLLPILYQLPNSDFHEVTSGVSNGSPSYSASPGYNLVTGLGSPYANRIVAALSQQSLGSMMVASPTGSGTISGPATSPTSDSPSPQRSSPDLFAEVASDALFLVEGWKSHTFPLELLGWQDFVSTVLNHPSEASQLEHAFFLDVLSDLYA